jgi:hypothetical protein
MNKLELSEPGNEGISPGVLKAREYADRIVDASESYELIIRGLGPAMISSINEALERRGYEISELDSTETDFDVPQDIATFDTDALPTYVAQMCEGRKPAVQELYADLLAQKSDPKKRAQLTKVLIGDTYRGLRSSEYESDPNEENIWAQAQNSQIVPSREQNGWMYRGNFGENGEDTVTRGSFNVHITPELITALDEYIASGAVKANYKFGAPNTPASPVERHDAISIYFLEKPNKKILDDLAQTVKPYVRGDNLLGEKVADGFYLSEIGSVQDKHIAHLIEVLDTIDPAFAKGVELEMTNKERLAMSEAQFYALKKTAELFGYKVDYHSVEGFTVELTA